MNYREQTGEKVNPRQALCIFPQLPFNLTHAFVLSLKAPFPLIASLFSITQCRRKEEAFSSWMPLPEVQY